MKRKIFFPHVQRCFIFMLVAYSIFCFTTRSSAEESVCAQVKIEIRQELTLERQAFDAHMRINNGLSHITLENIAIDVTFADELGDPVLATSNPDETNALFFITIDSMTNIDSIDGSGQVSPVSSADIHWLIIPAPGASNGLEQGTLYFVGATLSYTIGGEEYVMEVSPDYIFVKPMPELILDYFLQKDVYGDDAFTEEIEPSVPFSLGVRVSNNGAGTAHNLKIDSAQPKIVENEQGLLINFVIVGSEVNGQEMIPDLLVDFGNIDPGASGVGRWIMTCSLSGKFIEFTAEYSHSDELGGELTSLLENVNTHTLVRDVLVDLPGRDLVRDFLANDQGIFTVYESDSVDTVVENHSADADLQLVDQAETRSEHLLTVPPAGGFLYVQLADPYSGEKVLHTVIRSDGKIIKSENYWLSKTRDDDNNWHYFINLFDVNTTDSYSIIFEDQAVQPDAPVLQFISDRSIVEGEQLSFIVEASDPDGTIPMLSAAPMPALAGFTDQGDVGNGIATGLFDWTPAEGQAGRYEITFTASDGILETTRQAVLTIYPMDDRDGDGLPNDLEETTCTDPDDPDTDKDGIPDGVEDANQNGVVDSGETDPCSSDLEDADADGFSDNAELAAYSDPNNPVSMPGDTNLVFHAGYNQLSFPAETMYYGNLATLMEALGGSEVIKKMLICDGVSQTFTEAGYDGGGIFYGENSVLPAGQGLPGLIIYAKQNADYSFTSKYCHSWDLRIGINFVGTGCVPEELTAFDLLQDIGDNTVAINIQRFNPNTGTFETAAYDETGLPIGIDFPIVSGEGYIIYMKEPVAGYQPTP